MSIHADDEFSLRIALESELDDVLPSEGLAGLVIARHRKIRRRRVAGAVSLVIVCAGIGAALGFSGPSGKPPQHHPGPRPGQHTGSVTLIPHARTGAVLTGTVTLVVVYAGVGVRLGLCGPSGKPPQHNPLIELPAPGLPRCGGIGPESDAAQRGVTRCGLRAHTEVRDGRAACPDGRSPDQRAIRSCQAGSWRSSDDLGMRPVEAALAARIS